MKRALIAMSGGVDSSVAACRIKAEGIDCIGISMKLFDAREADCSGKSCSSREDAADARDAAEKLGIPFYCIDLQNEFRAKVIEGFVSAYEQGATPNPCIECNRYLKFEELYQKGRELGCDYMVTGHYARIEKAGGRYVLKKALDETKDQSYVLYSLTPEQLAHTRFPLGEMTKTEVREYAREHGLSNYDRPDSQDICFIPDGDYSSFIRGVTGRDYPEGDFVDSEGRILGRHKGIICYTIGQRKGLNVPGKAPYYVVRMDTDNNRVMLGANADLYTTELVADSFNWASIDEPEGEIRVAAKVRYRHKEQPASARVLSDGRVRVIFDEPQRAITCGQSVVLYDKDVVLGGGIIVQTGRQPEVKARG